MEAKVRTLENVFGNAVRLLVPLYQRPYVWEKKQQWVPLWDDVAAVAGRLYDQLRLGAKLKHAQNEVTPHFLGAIVLQRQHTAIGEIEQYAVIDGQQRLTTLQVLLSAALHVVRERGDEEMVELLANLVENTKKVKAEADRFKVWPTNNDRAAFAATMSSSSGATEGGSRIADAHRYFGQAIVSWVDSEQSTDARPLRLRSLASVLVGMLHVVAIELDQEENAQLIFETLNARSTQLLASDLIKNALFQALEEQGRDSLPLYEKYWQRLDSEEWRKEVRQGRLFRPRLDILLYYWLVMRELGNLTVHETFSVVRNKLKKGADPEELLASIAANAAEFAGFEREPPTSALGTFRYRVVKVMQTDAITPVLLWLFDKSRAVPAPQRDRALRALESWLVRRMLCRLTAKDHNKLFVELLKVLDTADRDHAGDAIEIFLLGQESESREWPTDEAIIKVASAARLYGRLSAGRLRMVLEAIEDHMRSAFSEQLVDRSKFTIEHVLPQSWTKHWPLAAEDAAAGKVRDQLLHTLGNLTLVTAKLNPKLSNGAWGPKRQALAEHSVLRLNFEMLSRAEEAWSEAEIRDRGQRLGATLLAIWKRPTPA